MAGVILSNVWRRRYTSFAAICTADVDEQYRWAFGQIREALVAKGSIQTTLEAMDEAEAKKIAVSILELLDTLQRDRPPICG